jgi:hypothetical protein
VKSSCSAMWSRISARVRSTPERTLTNTSATCALLNPQARRPSKPVARAPSASACVPNVVPQELLNLLPVTRAVTARGSPSIAWHRRLGWQLQRIFPGSEILEQATRRQGADRRCCLHAPHQVPASATWNTQIGHQEIKRGLRPFFLPNFECNIPYPAITPARAQEMKSRARTAE